MGREHTQGLRAFLRRSGDDLDAVLRSSRPVAPSAFVDELVGRVSNGAPVRTRPLQLLLAAVATSVMLVVFAGFGGIGYAASAARGVAQTVTAAATGKPPADKKDEGNAPEQGSGNSGNSTGSGNNSGGNAGGGGGDGNGEDDGGGGDGGNGNGGGEDGGGGDDNGGGADEGDDAGGGEEEEGEEQEEEAVAEAEEEEEDVEAEEDAGSAQYSNKVSICHATGSSTNPYVLITVSSNAVPAHRRHQNGEDIIPAPPAGCPTTAP